jgi:outer membrane autotransporter protein
MIVGTAGRLSSASSHARGVTARPERRLRTGVSLAALALAPVLTLALPERAAAQTWVGGTSSDWTDGSNWAGGTAPAGTPVNINTASPNPTVLGVSGAETVSINRFAMGSAAGTSSLTVQNGSSLTSPITQFGAAVGSTSVATVTGSGTTWTMSIASVGLSGTGTLNITDGAAATSTNLIVGLLGVGTLNITSGGQFTPNGTTTIGSQGTGAATISGPGSLLFSAGNVTVGAFGTATGTMTVEDGGMVRAANVSIGNAALASGTLNLTSDGILEAQALTAGPGTVQATFDGGVLRARADNATFVDAFTGTELDIAAGGLTVDSAGWNVTATSPFSGIGALTKTGAGTLVLSGDNVHGGGTIVDGGTLQAGTTTAFAQDTAYTVDDGTLDLNGFDLAMSSLAGAGGTVAFGVGNVSVDQSTDTSFAGAITGTGSFTKTGSGTLSLTGDSSAYAGAAAVDAGWLYVNGTLGGTLAVNDGAFLGGSGMVGATEIASGGTLAPGNSIGKLSVAGDITFRAGSTYEVEIAGDGTSDLIAATGTATLEGGIVQVATLDPETSYQDGRRYTILTAGTGVDGTFDGAATGSAFLEVSLDHLPNQVDLAIDIIADEPGEPEPPAVFQRVAATPNQRETAEALNELQQSGASLALYNALLLLNEEQARAAFGQLSGEIHASAMGVFVEDSRFLRNAGVDRLRSAFGAPGAPSIPVMAYGPDQLPLAASPSAGDGVVFWAHGFGSWGGFDDDGNAAAVDRSTGGMLVGADTMIADWRVGVLGGYSHTGFDVDDRLSSGNSDNYHVGIYAGTELGGFGIRTGLAYTWHDIDTSRTVAFPGFADQLSADYDAGTAQVFGELGYAFETGAVRLEPFGNLAYVNVDTDGFSEEGGAAALSSRGGSMNTLFTTLGIRAETRFALGGIEARARGMIGWRHAFGDTAPETANAFAGLEAFSIAGAPIAEDAAVIEAGFDFDLSETATLGLSYAGQVASDAQDHGVRASLGIRF